MWHLMSTEGPEVMIGERTHTLDDGVNCVVVAVVQCTRRVRLRFEDGEELEMDPGVIGCYLLLQEHPGED